MYNAQIAKEIEDQNEDSANPPRTPFKLPVLTFDNYLKAFFPPFDPDDQRDNEQNL